MSQILYCPYCKTYTLNKICRNCQQKTISKKPARFSPQDPYGKYRRKLKKIEKNVKL